MQSVLFNELFTELPSKFFILALSYGMNKIKPFRVAFFFFFWFKSPKLHVEFAGLAIDSHPPLFFFFKFLQFIRKRQAKEPDDLTFNAAGLQ